MYRARGPSELKSVGEVEFVCGIAAMADSGLFGNVKLCAGIVGGVDLRLGDAVQDVLHEHLKVGGNRYRGIRPQATSYDDGLESLKHVLGVPHLLLDPTFRAGFAQLEALGLSCDLYVMESQLPELIDLARAFPATQIIVNHLGGPVGIGPYAGRRDERFAYWLGQMRDLARCENVVVKLGGLGMALCGFASSAREPRAGSEALAKDWRPCIEGAIEIFGVRRCMFESNFPVDGVTASYPAIWNAFKRITGGASGPEKSALFRETATRVYRLDI
jgi:predicted TIM-barrel fold metal-dependent hydrolase